MSQSTVTLNGNAVSQLTQQIPAWGCWWADVALQEPIELAAGASATLAIGGTTAAGTVLTGGALDGRAAYRIVGGAGGWHREVPAKGYRHITGVRASTVVEDLALAVGETVSGAPEIALSEHYTRPRGGAYRTLNAIAPQAWYVGLDGVTRFGSRPTLTYSGDGSITRRDAAIGVVEIETTDFAQLIPGVQINGSAPATDVEIVLADQRLFARVYSAATTTRRLRAFARLLDAIDPLRKFRGIYEYRVVLQSGDRLDLQAARAANELPDLRGVPIHPGMAGLRADVALGSVVLVGFANADPSRPAVLAHAPPDSPGWMPLFLELGGPGALGVARVTDPVVAGAFAGTITAGSLRVKASL